MTGEYGEWTKLYPGYAQTAREEGLDEIAVLFEQISQIEKDHEFRFMSACRAQAQPSGKGVRTHVPGAGGHSRRLPLCVLWRCLRPPAGCVRRL